jgi:lysophospholipase L1-like esterase
MRPTALILAMAMFVMATLAAAVPAAAQRRAVDYVALGDSYAAGPGVLTRTGAPAGCQRSDRNYPSVLAHWLQATTFTDVTCGGATTAHIITPQPVPGGSNAPQLDAVNQGTDLVTLTIGGNDIGFGEILNSCGQAGATDPDGALCKAFYSRDGPDVLAGRIADLAPKIVRVLSEIRQRAPNAEILVVGYLRILPSATGCWPQMPFAKGDTEYFDDTERLLNSTIGDTARKAGARFINPYPASRDHDTCQVPERRWVEPLRPASPASPAHPNAKGMAVVAALAWFAINVSR